MRWRDTENWEAKLLLIENQFKRLLRQSDDPILREMAMDDAQIMKMLGILAKLVTEQLMRRGSRELFRPKNARELMQLIQFISDNQSRIMGAQQEKEAGARSGPTVYVDNRRLVLRERLGVLPIPQRRMVIDQMRGATMDQQELGSIREEVWGDDQPSSAG